nr:hypothetical protein [Tanacetum cinerariifolium]
MRFQFLCTYEFWLKMRLRARSTLLSGGGQFGSGCCCFFVCYKIKSIKIKFNILYWRTSQVSNTTAEVGVGIVAS